MAARFAQGSAGGQAPAVDGLTHAQVAELLRAAPDLDPEEKDDVVIQTLQLIVEEQRKQAEEEEEERQRRIQAREKARKTVALQYG